MNGLINLGNTCYMNSALQFLLNVDDFVLFVKNNSNESNFLNIMNIFINNYENKKQILNPIEIKKYIGKNVSMFNNFNQHDSSELIIYLIDLINKETENKISHKISDSFNIKYVTSVKCKLLKCLKENENKSEDIFLCLSYSENLTKSYRDYKQNEKLEKENSYMCETCNKKTIARKKIVINKWPKNLFILLNRYTNSLQKRGSKIEVPLNWRHNYKLKGGIIHMGSLSGGHYVYFGYKNNNWYLFNDSRITLLSNENLNNIKNNAYILHYKMSSNIDA
jgi:ubiquitin carboxyl-terminal hydrolase 7